MEYIIRMFEKNNLVNFVCDYSQKKNILSCVNLCCFELVFTKCTHKWQKCNKNACLFDYIIYNFSDILSLYLKNLYHKMCPKLKQNTCYNNTDDFIKNFEKCLVCNKGKDKLINGKNCLLEILFCNMKYHECRKLCDILLSQGVSPNFELDFKINKDKCTLKKLKNECEKSKSPQNNLPNPVLPLSPDIKDDDLVDFVGKNKMDEIQKWWIEGNKNNFTKWFIAKPEHCIKNKHFNKWIDCGKHQWYKWYCNKPTIYTHDFKPNKLSNYINSSSLQNWWNDNFSPNKLIWYLSKPRSDLSQTPFANHCLDWFNFMNDHGKKWFSDRPYVNLCDHMINENDIVSSDVNYELMTENF